MKSFTELEQDVRAVESAFKALDKAIQVMATAESVRFMVTDSEPVGQDNLTARKALVRAITPLLPAIRAQFQVELETLRREARKALEAHCRTYLDLEIP